MYGQPERHARRKTRLAAAAITLAAGGFAAWAALASNSLVQVIAAGFAAVLAALALLAWTLRSALITETRDLAAHIVSSRQPGSQVESR